MAMGSSSPVLLGVFFFLFSFCGAQMPGFVSIDCGGPGGIKKYIDDLGLEWVPDSQLAFGKTAGTSNPDKRRMQYRTVRYFPADDRKYCYTLDVTTRTRYVVRASFLYGNFDNRNVYSKFDISLGATPWSTIVISDGDTIEFKELTLLASSPTISVCLSNATSGQPFISTLELRQLNGSLYRTIYETQFYLSLSARINFGADSNDSVRYPDDPFDRIWESDSVTRENYLDGVAPGTENISTKMAIDTHSGHLPPQKVMQTAVAGRNGSLTYRLYLDGFPANGWAFLYFAEIEDLSENEVRMFKLFIPGFIAWSNFTINVQQSARGKYRLYEPGYTNISLRYAFSFELNKTDDATLGPILNAFEIHKYLKIGFGSEDASTMANFTSHYPLADWAQEGGDPCVPASWSWVQCNSDQQPKIISIILSRKNLTGDIPSELATLTGLVELRLDGNSLTGAIPDFSGCLNMELIHLENNALTGELPSSLTFLPSLKELYLQNNLLSGKIPQGLLYREIIFNYSGNTNLHEEKNGNDVALVVCNVLGGLFLLALVGFCSFHVLWDRNNRSEDNVTTISSVQPAQSGYRLALSEIQDATNNFEKEIGSGGTGKVYSGKLKNGQEIAAKVHDSSQSQGIDQFSNEVEILSKIHHRNLIKFIGFSQEGGKNILVYEYMRKGDLGRHLHGAEATEEPLTWEQRLKIAEGAAKAVEYLHTECTPAIYHRDLKSPNILLDEDKTAKVSDFGLSRYATNDFRFSIDRPGTTGYVEPGYACKLEESFTDRMDVYSFGIILLELIAGRPAIVNQHEHILKWARPSIEKKENVQAIIDPQLKVDDHDVLAVWRIAELAMKCVGQPITARPSMSEVLKEIQDVIAMKPSGEEKEGPDSKDPLDRL